MTDPVNKPLATVDSIINTAVMSLALQAADKAMEAAYPIPLEYPVIKPIFELGMKESFRFIDTALEQLAAFAVIDAESNAEARAYQIEVAALKAAIDSGDKDAIDKASSDFDSKLGKLIHF